MGRRLRLLFTRLLFTALFVVATPLVAGTTTQQYDEVGRLVRVDFETGASIRFVYDQAGNLLERVVSLADDPVEGDPEPEPEVDVAEAPDADAETSDAPVVTDADVVSSDLVVHVDADAGAAADGSAELPSSAGAEEDDRPRKGSGCVYGGSSPQAGPGSLLFSVLLLLAALRRVSGLRRGEG